MAKKKPLPEDVDKNPPRKGEGPSDVVKNPPRKEKTTKKRAKSSTRKKRTKKALTKSNTGASGQKVLLMSIITIGGLVALFYGLLLWSLLSGGVNASLFANLGMGPVTVKNTLLGMTNFLFGTIGLGLMVGGLVRTFQYLMASPKQKELRRRHGIASAIFGALLAFIVIAWVTIYYLVSSVAVDQQVEESTNMVRTVPEIVTGLASPIDVAFDIGTELDKQIDPKLVRQIRWDFDGDGVFDADGRNVTYRFLDKGKNDGRYPVDVVVYFQNPRTGEEDVVNTSREVIITNEAVSAVLGADIVTGTSPLTVNFTADDSVDPDGQILEYSWDLDEDGVYEINSIEPTEQTMTFEKLGEYVVRLKVRGVNNDESVAEQIIIVTAPEENLKAVINSPVGFTANAPFDVELDAEESFSRFGRITKYEWQIEGEDRPRSGNRVKVKFREPGTYAVRLTVTNQDGENAETAQDIVITEDYSGRQIEIRTTPPMAPKTTRVTGTAPLSVTFDSSPSTIKDPVSWEWDFENDGIVDNFSPATTHTFGVAGEYISTLKMIDAFGNVFEGEYDIIVKPQGTIARVKASPQSGIVPFTVEFDGSGSTSDDGDIINYEWTFPGQAPISYQSQISYEFDNVGTFPVNLKITTTTGQVAEEEILITVREQPVKAGINASATSGSAPLTVQFDPLASKGTIVKYEWDFGDGRRSTQYTPNYVYRSAGMYTVTLKVTDPKGVVDTQTVEIVVD